MLASMERRKTEDPQPDPQAEKNICKLSKKAGNDEKDYTQAVRTCTITLQDKSFQIVGTCKVYTGCSVN